MVESEELSPASMPTKPIITWSDKIKGTKCNILEDGNVAEFLNSGGYKYCRSLEEFTSGSYRFEINIDLGHKDSEVSFGIAHSPNLSCNASHYYFPDAYIYCNTNQSFTKDYDNIHKTIPEKVLNNSSIAINFDFDSKKLFWELNGKKYEELDFETKDRPVYVVVGMREGKATFI